MAFFPLLLASILFMTEVWGREEGRAGQHQAPGPDPARERARRPREQRHHERAGRDGQPGLERGVLACVCWNVSAGTTPDYLADMLPSTILTGAGVALTFPTLAGAAVSSLPPERTATGSALFNMARQIGGVVGIAAFVAILGSGVPDLAGFRAGWALMAAAALAAGAVVSLLPAPRPEASAERPYAETSSAAVP